MEVFLTNVCCWVQCFKQYYDVNGDRLDGPITSIVCSSISQRQIALSWVVLNNVIFNCSSHYSHGCWCLVLPCTASSVFGRWKASLIATTVVLVVVVTRFRKMPKALLIRNGKLRNFAYTLVISFPTDLPS